MGVNWQDDGQDPDPVEGRGAALVAILGAILTIAWLLLWNLR